MTLKGQAGNLNNIFVHIFQLHREYSPLHSPDPATIYSEDKLFHSKNNYKEMAWSATPGVAKRVCDLGSGKNLLFGPGPPGTDFSSSVYPYIYSQAIYI